MILFDTGFELSVTSAKDSRALLPTGPVGKQQPKAQTAVLSYRCALPVLYTIFLVWSRHTTSLYFCLSAAQYALTSTDWSFNWPPCKRVIGWRTDGLSDSQNRTSMIAGLEQRWVVTREYKEKPLSYSRAVVQTTE
jgi:hypothetical protein